MPSTAGFPAASSPAGGKELPAGDVLVLGHDVIHSVANSRREFAVAVHVYGGDFFSVGRSEWDFETYEERPRRLPRAPAGSSRRPTPAGESEPDRALPVPRSSAARSRRVVIASCSMSPHCSRGTIHMTSNSLPSGSLA